MLMLSRKYSVPFGFVGLQGMVGIRTQENTSVSSRVNVTFVTSDGTRHTVQGKEGDSLLDVVIDKQVPLDGYGMSSLLLAFRVWEQTRPLSRRLRRNSGLLDLPRRLTQERLRSLTGQAIG